MHQSVRILLFNPANELLFMGAEDKSLTGKDGNKGRFWFLVGGTIEAGETFQAAVKRELTEEAGLTDEDVVWGAEIAEGVVHLKKNGKPLDIYQRFIVAKTEKDTVHPNNLDEWEQNAVKGLRWFSQKEIQTSRETLYPRTLKAYLPQIISDLPKVLSGDAPEKLAVWDLD
jgi:8-oxo-dGTP pyrophosphatase MutT (NUDIX family)